MKKMILVLAVIGMAAVGASTARAGVNISIGIPGPVFYPAPRVVYVQPAPVVVAAAPVCVAPAPVYAPAPVFVAPPVVYAPRPVVRFDFGFGHYRPFYRHGHW